MKHHYIYVALALVVGLFLGYVLFGTSTSETHETHEHTSDEVTNAMWTCAMHPQIMKTEAGDCPICGMELIPVTTDASGLTAQQFKLTKNAEALANITTSVVGETNDTSQHLKLSGTIQVNDDELFIQPAHFNGRIEKLYVTSLGQQVHKGQLVAKVYSPELINAQQELITAYQLKSTQPELYNAVRNKFKNWMIHDEQLQDIETSGEVITQFKIYSHVSGTVSEISAKTGDHIMDGKAIFKVANLNTVWATFDAYESDINSLKVGQLIDVSVKSYPNTKFQSKITFIDPILNASTRTVNVRTVLQNTEHLFKPGMFVEGVIKTNKDTNTKVKITIPTSAVMWTGKRSIVYLKVSIDAPVFEMRDIVLGNKIGETYQVLEGLTAGDIIVTHGTFTVDAAAQLQGKASMMTKKDTHTIQTKPMASEQFQEVPELFQNALGNVLVAYISLKDALVGSDFESAMLQSNQVLEMLNAVDGHTISNRPEMMKTWLAISSQMKKDLFDIQNVTELESLRLQFSKLSLDLKTLIENYGVSQKVYVQFCPMANQNDGGYWLSLSADILNPYYGERMLTCGENDKIVG
ncbi:efflux RND transporter periplasmic adaptor subunit [Formosa algae]|uniref:Cu(I)/Ag(I) efflux system membrane fusion protein n=1 Tax=Formosa algae TaxID=225843 RepID=A0A9X0YMK8_9FLAO|nr:efflux RND transporter periplasmic adaptor subunit [Formosa algae]MBP1841315.1 Cu(I)/Ag(I) efflux system membrane fusion protein [Formosa algae]MDQ0336763.1 Cu(I)/Ag(I) efflux system membrane fusion protein [Formosa algae]OEI78805.1 hypothetical protein AST99_17685 [Formosa algae]